MRTVSERNVQLSDGTEAQVGTSRQRILNNVFVDNFRGAVSLPGPRGTGNVSDFNLLLNGTQWQGEGLRFSRFTPNGSDRPLLSAVFAEALDAHGAPAEQRPNFLLWPEQPLLTLAASLVTHPVLIEAYSDSSSA